MRQAIPSARSLIRSPCTLPVFKATSPSLVYYCRYAAVVSWQPFLGTVAGTLLLSRDNPSLVLLPVCCCCLLTTRPWHCCRYTDIVSWQPFLGTVAGTLLLSPDNPSLVLLPVHCCCLVTTLHWYCCRYIAVVSWQPFLNWYCCRYTVVVSWQPFLGTVAGPLLLYPKQSFCWYIMNGLFLDCCHCSVFL